MLTPASRTDPTTPVPKSGNARRCLDVGDDTESEWQVGAAAHSSFQDSRSFASLRVNGDLAVRLMLCSLYAPWQWQ